MPTTTSFPFVCPTSLFRTWTSSNNIYSVLANTRGLVTVGAEYKERNSNSNWKVAVAQGSDATSAYYADVLEAYKPARFGNIVRAWDKSGVTSEQQTVAPIFGFAPQGDLGLRDLALKRLKSKLATSQNEFRSLVPLAESRELQHTYRSTADLTETLLNTLLHPRRAITRANFRDAKKFASDAWLNYSFGVSPLIADAKALSSTISDVLSQRGEDRAIARYRSGAEKTFNMPPQTLYFTGADTSEFHVIYGIQYTLSYLFGAGVRTNPRSASHQDLSHTFHTRIEDVVPAVYELIPYSWLLDYFTTAGDTIEDVFTAPSGNTMFAWENVRTVYSTENVSVKPIAPLGLRQVLHNFPSEAPSASGYYFRRIPLGSVLPHRSFRIKSLDEIGVNSIKRVLNLTSLLLNKNRRAVARR